MSVFDLIVLAILAFLTIRGVLKGMVSQIVAILSLVLSWIIATRFAFLLAPSIPAESPWNKIGAMLILFLVSMLAIRFASRLIEHALKCLRLEGLNKLLGGVFGLVKGVLLCMILTFLGVMVSESTREIVFQSQSGKRLALLIERCKAFIPEDSCQLLSKKIDEFQQTIRGDANTSEILDQFENERSRERQRVSQLFTQTVASNGEVENAEPSSLLDAIGKWWKGEDSQPTEPALQAQQRQSIQMPERIAPPVAPRSLSDDEFRRYQSMAEAGLLGKPMPAASNRNLTSVFQPSQRSSSRGVASPPYQGTQQGRLPVSVLDDPASVGSAQYSAESEAMSIPRAALRVPLQPSKTATPVKPSSATPAGQSAKLFVP